MNGKGSKRRSEDRGKYERNYSNIFRVKNDKRNSHNRDTNSK